MNLINEVQVSAEQDDVQLDPWTEKLRQIANLKDGWNRYSAPAPNQRAIAAARLFLEVMKDEGQQPTRVAASAVGGVGITQRQGERMSYVEFSNAGSIHALLTDDASEGETLPLQAGKESLKAFLAQAKAFLNG